MELMHQMTLSVQAVIIYIIVCMCNHINNPNNFKGKPIDPASMLADIAEAKRLPVQLTEVTLPLPTPEDTFAGPSHSNQQFNTPQSSDKYPALNKFLRNIVLFFINEHF